MERSFRAKSCLSSHLVTVAAIMVQLYKTLLVRPEHSELMGKARKSVGLHTFLEPATDAMAAWACLLGNVQVMYN